MTTIPLIDKEFKALIPPLSNEEHTQLEQNILAKRKCHDAIVLWQGLIIDGHHRYEICINHGIEFEVKEMSLPTREDAKLWILQNQLCRRNLCDAAKIEIALRKEEILRSIAKKNQTYGGRPRKGEDDANPPNHWDEKGSSKVSKSGINTIDVQKAMASEADVSVGTFHRYSKLKEEAHPALLAQVQSGEVKIGTAHRMLPNEIFKQLARTDKMLHYIVKAVPPQGLKAANPGLHEKMTNLAEDLRALITVLGEKFAQQHH